MSKRHHRDDFSDFEEETFAMLGSRFRKVASFDDARDFDRRRRADSESDDRPSTRRTKHHRERIRTH